MKKAWIGLVAAALLAAVGCNGTPGGPGATHSSKPLIGEAENSFHLDMPALSTSIKQGETKSITIGIKRGKNFDQDVHLKFSELPKGLTVDPAGPVIKHDDAQVKLTIKAANDAALGDFTIKTTGHPSQGADASADWKVTVSKK